MTRNDNILQELKELGSPLADQPCLNPFTVPAGYFESLASLVMQRIRAMEAKSATEEIEKLSPFLAGLKKEMPFTIPTGYFESLQVPLQHTAKLVSFNARKWWRYAAAAVVTGFILMSGFMIWKTSSDPQGMPIARYQKWLSREMNRMSDVELVEFLQYSDAGLNGEEKVTVSPDNDVKELLEDIPVADLKEFIEETSDIDTEEVLMN